MTGLAADGGLYLNNSWDTFNSHAELAALAPLTYQQLCKRVLEKFSPFVSPWELEQVVNEGYSTFSHPAVLPLASHGDDFYTLDQWHGPTASFKDLSLQVEKFNLLVWTSHAPVLFSLCVCSCCLSSSVSNATRPTHRRGGCWWQHRATRAPQRWTDSRAIRCFPSW